MRKSTVLFFLVSIVCALAAGCSPYADRGPIAFAPRVFPYVPGLRSTSAPTTHDDFPTSDVQR